MTSRSEEKTVSQLPPWGTFPSFTSSLLRDLPVMLAGLAIFYGLLTFARYGIGPVGTQAEILLSPHALPKYASFSLLRIALAYFLSLTVAVTYGYMAAYNAKAERVMIPLLDALQSIPVLSFLPGVMLAMISLVPRRQLGVELGSIVLILTGQVWNMTFSFYSSLKSIPQEMREAAAIYRWGRWQRLVQMELPFAAIGLIWNSMMSVAGAWFFLMACEMFILGSRDLRLPGLGSYLQTVANAGDFRAIAWGVAVMVSVIVIIDQIVWRPVIAWAEKFKFEQVEGVKAPRSPVLDLVRRSHILALIRRAAVEPAVETMKLHFARTGASRPQQQPGRWVRNWIARVLVTGGIAACAYALVRMVIILAGLSRAEIREIVWGAAATFVRVEATLMLAALWTIPVGLWVGLSEARLSGPADRANRSVSACYGSVPCRAVGFDPPRWRTWDRIDGATAAGYAVVPPVQCYCWRKRHPK